MSWARYWLYLLLLLTVASLSCTSLSAYEVTLTWDANTEQNLAGYRLHYGAESRQYSTTVDVANVTQYTLEIPSKTYIAATAYNTEGLESDYSKEVFYEFELHPATNGQITYYDIGGPIMSVIFDEKFEGAGYEESGWGENINTGTVDEDANVTDVGSPAGWDSQCLKIVGKAAKVNYAYNFIGDGSIRYTSFDFCFTDLSSLTSDGNRAYIAAALNNAGSTFCWWARAYREADGDIVFSIAYYYDGSNNASIQSIVIEEDVVYHVDIKWDSTNDVFACAINGTQIYKNLPLVAGHVEMGLILLGGSFTANVVDSTVYIDNVIIDDADWVREPDRIFNEDFEATGYVRESWIESLGASSLDKDADPADVSSPSGWGNNCAKLIQSGGATSYAYNATIGAEPITYWRIEVVVTAESLSNGQSTILACCYNNAIGKVVWRLILYQDSGTLYLVFDSQHDGSPHVYVSFSSISLGTRYRVEIKWDATNDKWSWKIDGVVQPNDQDSSHPVTTEGLLTSTHATDAGTIVIGYHSANIAFTCYYDLIACSKDDWVGAEPAEGISIPIVMHHYQMAGGL